MIVLPKEKSRKIEYTFDDVENLRHTIRVNVRIMSGELDSLYQDLEAAGDFALRVEVKELLDKAVEVRDTADLVVSHAGYEELSEFLGVVFNTMIGTSDARRILNELQPQ